GGEWSMITELWWSLEKSTGFVSLTKGFSATGRPDEIKLWVKYARKGTPAVRDVTAFASNLRTWWKSINPKWRVGADGELKQAEEGEWTELEAPGANGFLNVLIALRWWKEKAGDDPKWANSVADVTWVSER
ncbi:hypothetical protein C8F04DRAFT_921610, partial [Mycena alexandri]